MTACDHIIRSVRVEGGILVGTCARCDRPGMIEGGKFIEAIGVVI